MALNNITHNPWKISGSASETGSVDFSDTFAQGNTEISLLVVCVTGSAKVSVGQAPHATNSPTLSASDSNKSKIVVTVRNNETELFYEGGGSAWEIWVTR